MKIGDIIRRKTKAGKPIGPYLIVTGIGEKISAKTIDSTNVDFILLKENVYQVKTTTLYISKLMLSELSCGSRICVQHPASVRWNSVVNKHIEVVRLRCKPQEYEHIFVVERAYYEYSLQYREKLVRIVLSYKLC
jgi:hypothetical protein